MTGLKDRFERTIDYMRVSVTDRCNLRCIYCMPSQGLLPMEHGEILRYEEIVRIIRIAAHLGVKKIRITGGEPLVRRDIPYLIESIKGIESIKDLSLTTNGILLEKYADAIAGAGLNRVNISLDSLDPGRYREITRGGDINAVFRGIAAAERAGLNPIKINMVPIQGVNDDEIVDFAAMTLGSPYQIRFIEFMPFGMRGAWKPEKFISAEGIKAIAEKIGPLSPVKMKKAGPAKYFRFDEAQGVLGFISPLSNHFCAECSRLRLTADGKLRPCLFSETEIDLKYALRSNASDAEVERLMRLSITVKPKGHHMQIQNIGLSGFASPQKGQARPMSKIGG